SLRYQTDEWCRTVVIR
ncbi:hypothetical protein pipiens_000487, partial [Culex pipiens pipiens]